MKIMAREKSTRRLSPRVNVALSKMPSRRFHKQDFGCDVSVHDPVADPDDAMHEYQIPLVAWEDLPAAEAIVAAVSHREYLAMPNAELLAKLAPGGVFVDVKSAYDAVAIEAAGYRLWRL